ncbi:39S ribosomal protein L52, mitochondrial [Gryllus bimaculatus]|nr:39S ribosomal protein L52, mitochondrial [Gryllus bimaculatus]
MNSRVLVCYNLYQQRKFQTSALYCINRQWREGRGLPINPTSFGPLTNKPDFAYDDGRPVPLGSNARKRVVKQRTYAARIVQLLNEVNFAEERHRKLKEEEEQLRNKILENKLTPKGKKELD